MKSINVFGLKVKIHQAKGLMEKEGLEAVYDPNLQVILIDETLSGNRYLLAILHEAIHAALDRTGMNQTSLTKDNQELICENISTLIVENFKITPKK